MVDIGSPLLDRYMTEKISLIGLLSNSKLGRVPFVCINFVKLEMIVIIVTMG
jgi:hypothetical protein